MQTCLEKTGINKRNDELVRNDYQKNDPYSATHEDALNKDENNLDDKGKGTGSGGHTAFKPSCNPSIDGSQNMIDYSNFDTTRGGNLYDVEGCEYNGTSKMAGRRFELLQNTYNKENPYGATSVDTSLNQEDGQYIVS
jgi:hypothetical protein